MPDAAMKRLWFYPARELSGPWIGVPGSRPPIYLGGDEHGRRTVVFQLPGVGAAVLARRASRRPRPQGETDAH